MGFCLNSMNEDVSVPKRVTWRLLALACVLLVFTGPAVEGSSFFPEEGTGSDDPEVMRLLSTAKSSSGDIRIDDMVFRVSDLQKSGFLGTKWTDGIVYYEFDANVNATNQTRWLNAAANWSAVANLTFVEHTTELNYIHVFSGTGNWSYVGMIGGQQDLSIYNWTYEFIIAHEIGHALGLKHEHSRSDRDTYVVIHWDNIADICGTNNDEPCDYNFYSASTTNYGGYDFDSVMHYGRCSFSNGTCPPTYTISAQPAYSAYNDAMGQRTHLSTLDEDGMAAHYGPAGHIFSNGFEDGNVNGWSSGLGVTCTGEVCGEYTSSCQPLNPNCTCYTTYWGAGVCAGDFFCLGLTSCPGGVGCGVGEVCVVETCCASGAPVCIPNYCSLANIAPLPQPGVATTRSCR